jgi:SAM-dependent methyltransferase
VDGHLTARHVPRPDNIDEILMKAYDHDYYNRWYRDPEDRVTTREGLERKVRMAVAVTEFLLGGRIRTVVDIGCGEAPWFPVLRSLRRNVRYIGVESSDYAIERYGRERNIRRGTLGELAKVRLPRDVDLVVCADVMQYVPTPDIERGLRAIRRILGGVLYVETFTTRDAMEGDHDGWHERSALDYLQLFGRVGLTQCGPYCWIDRQEHPGLNEFETLSP